MLQFMVEEKWDFLRMRNYTKTRKWQLDKVAVLERGELPDLDQPAPLIDYPPVRLRPALRLPPDLRSLLEGALRRVP